MKTVQINKMKVNIFEEQELKEKLQRTTEEIELIVKYQRMFPELVQNCDGFPIDARKLHEKIVANVKEDKNGESVYIEPRVGVEFNLSKAGMQILNNDIFDADSKKRIRDGNLFPYEKEILGMDVTIKMPLDEAWNKIMEGKESITTT